MSSIVINYRYQSIAIGDWYRVYRLISDIDFYRSTTPVSLATSCNNSSRRQITPCVQVGRLVAATRWGDTSQRQIASCVLENFCENLSPQQNFTTATSRKKSNQTEFVRLVAATKFCCSDKDFHKNSVRKTHEVKMTLYQFHPSIVCIAV